MEATRFEARVRDHGGLAVLDLVGRGRRGRGRGLRSAYAEARSRSAEPFS